MYFNNTLVTCKRVIVFKLNSSKTGKLNALYSIKGVSEYLLNEKQPTQMG